MSGEHHIHFSSATVWTGAENVPPIGSWVGGGGGGGGTSCHVSYLAFFAVILHFGMPAFGSKEEFTSMSAMSHS